MPCVSLICFYCLTSWRGVPKKVASKCVTEMQNDLSPRHCLCWRTHCFWKHLPRYSRRAQKHCKPCVGQSSLQKLNFFPLILIRFFKRQCCFFLYTVAERRRERIFYLVNICRLLQSLLNILLLTYCLFQSSVVWFGLLSFLITSWSDPRKSCKG